jgi:phage terminase small subunit
MNKLTDKQSRFVSEYLVDFDSTNSAKRAGYSERSARTIGCDNLNKPYIKIEIKKRIEALCDASFLSRDLIVLALLREAHDRAEGSSPSARVSALDKLAKIFGLYMSEPLVNISLEKTISDISRENSQARKSLLPKDNINFDEIS